MHLRCWIVFGLAALSIVGCVSPTEASRQASPPQSPREASPPATPGRESKRAPRRALRRGYWPTAEWNGKAGGYAVRRKRGRTFAPARRRRKLRPGGSNRSAKNAEGSASPGADVDNQGAQPMRRQVARKRAARRVSKSSPGVAARSEAGRATARASQPAAREPSTRRTERGATRSPPSGAGLQEGGASGMVPLWRRTATALRKANDSDWRIQVKDLDFVLLHIVLERGFTASECVEARTDAGRPLVLMYDGSRAKLKAQQLKIGEGAVFLKVLSKPGQEFAYRVSGWVNETSWGAVCDRIDKQRAAGEFSAAAAYARRALTRVQTFREAGEQEAEAMLMLQVARNLLLAGSAEPALVAYEHIVEKRNSLSGSAERRLRELKACQSDPGFSLYLKALAACDRGSVGRNTSMLETALLLSDQAEWKSESSKLRSLCRQLKESIDDALASKE
jgi:hypothetical protein